MNEKNNIDRESFSGHRSPGKEKVYRNNIRLWSLVFILFGVTSYLVSGLIPSEMNNLIGLICVFAGAFITTGFFSILLGFTDFMNYITRRLSGIVVENEYIEVLSRDQKLALKRTIDGNLFSKEAVESPDSLYSFIDKQIASILTTPYRREFHDHYTYRDSEYEDYWEQTNKTVYHFYIHDFKDIYDEDLKIRFSNEMIPPMQDPHLADILRDYTIQIDDELLEYVKTDDGAILKPNPNNQYLKQNIDVQMDSVPQGNSEKVRIHFSFCLDRRMFEEKNYVLVNMDRRILLSKDENNLYLIMSYPTKDMMLICEFHSGDYILEGTAFGFEPKSHIKRFDKNSASIDIKEWIFPGHGAVVTWKKHRST